MKPNDRIVYILLMIGLPRSGKSTLAGAMQNRCGGVILCPDDFRWAYYKKSFDPDLEDLVWPHVRKAFVGLARRNDFIIIDATNIDKARRKEWANVLKHEALEDIHFEPRYFVVESSAGVCIERAQMGPYTEDEKRGLIGAIMRMKDRFEHPKHQLPGDEIWTQWLEEDEEKLTQANFSRFFQGVFNISGMQLSPKPVRVDGGTVHRRHDIRLTVSPVEEFYVEPSRFGINMHHPPHRPGESAGCFVIDRSFPSQKTELFPFSRFRSPSHPANHDPSWSRPEDNEWFADIKTWPNVGNPCPFVGHAANGLISGFFYHPQSADWLILVVDERVALLAPTAWWKYLQERNDFGFNTERCVDDLVDCLKKHYGEDLTDIREAELTALYAKLAPLMPEAIQVPEDKVVSDDGTWEWPSDEELLRWCQGYNRIKAPKGGEGSAAINYEDGIYPAPGFHKRTWAWCKVVIGQQIYACIPLMWAYLMDQTFYEGEDMAVHAHAIAALMSISNPDEYTEEQKVMNDVLPTFEGCVIQYTYSKFKGTPVW